MTRTTVLEPEDFPPAITTTARETRRETAAAPAGTPLSAGTSLEEIEKTHILRVLEETNYNKSRAAALLGIDRKTLHRKAQRYGIALKERD